jgi:hypothetical protein
MKRKRENAESTKAMITLFRKGAGRSDLRIMLPSQFRTLPLTKAAQPTKARTMDKINGKTVLTLSVTDLAIYHTGTPATIQINAVPAANLPTGAMAA